MIKMFMSQGVLTIATVVKMFSHFVCPEGSLFNIFLILKVYDYIFMPFGSAPDKKGVTGIIQG